ncbi:MAG: glycosyltransferase [Candidatus Nanohaloarchaea archaeon]
MSVSIILPTLNEREGIEQTMEDIEEISDDIDIEEVLVVDGESTDGTREKAEELGARVIVEERKGYGRAYKTGFSEAKGDIYVTLDPDGTYPVHSIPELVEDYREGDYRFLSTNRSNDGLIWISKIGNFGLNVAAKLLHQTDFEDTQSGMWVMDSELPEDLNLTSDGMPFSEEIKLKAESNYPVKEVDIDYGGRIGEEELEPLKDGPLNLYKFFRMLREDDLEDGKMKILAANKYDWEHPNVGGAEINLRETLSRLADEGHSVHLFTAMYPGAEKEEILDGVHVHRFGRENSTNEIMVNTLGQIKLNYLIQKLRPDVVYGVKSPFPWFPLTRRKKVTAFHHLNEEVYFESLDFPLDWLSYAYERLGVLTSKFEEVISVSPSTTDDLVEKGLEREEITEIRNGVNHEKFDAGFGEKPRVLFLGRLDEGKGADRIPEIYESVVEQYGEDFQLDIAGTGWRKDDIEEFASKHENVEYHGFVSEEKKQELFEKAWVKIVPSRREGWGLTVMEANAAGTPVVAFDNGALSHSVKQGETGQLVQNPHFQEFGQKVAELLKDEEQRHEMSENARSWAIKHDWEQTTKELEEVLEN